MAKLLHFFELQKFYCKFVCAQKINLLVLLLLVECSVAIFAQQGQLEGRVLYSKTNEPVIVSSVVLVSDQKGTVTDQNGNFSIQVKSLPAALVIGYLGYKTIEVDIFEYNEPVVVFLNEDVNLLDQVVVVGYGTQKRKELTGSVATVSKVALQQPVASFDNALGGA
ncbi:MAG: carboxypeptidase-like regulatory domain-containing protein, partial [Tannerella sp.]|nr:carboxypeptidase-like regulatory domain-containing protein [Tannerella sp.]